MERHTHRQLRGSQRVGADVRLHSICAVDYHRRKIRRAVGTGVGAGDPHRHLGIPGHKKGTLLQRGAGRHALYSRQCHCHGISPGKHLAYLYHGLKIGVYAPEASMGKRSEKPLNTDSTTTMAIVATA